MSVVSPVWWSLIWKRRKSWTGFSASGFVVLIRTLPPAGISSKVYEVSACFSFITGTPGGNLVMDEHGNGEFPVRKHRDNVRQVRPDGLHVLGILSVVRGHFDRSTV